MNVFYVSHTCASLEEGSIGFSEDEGDIIDETFLVAFSSLLGDIIVRILLLFLLLFRLETP